MGRSRARRAMVVAAGVVAAGCSRNRAAPQDAGVVAQPLVARPAQPDAGVARAAPEVNLGGGDAGGAVVVAVAPQVAAAGAAAGGDGGAGGAGQAGGADAASPTPSGAFELAVRVIDRPARPGHDGPQHRIEVALTEPGAGVRVLHGLDTQGTCNTGVQPGSLVRPLPQNVIAFGQCWWAGAGDDVVVVRRGAQVHVMVRQVDEQAPPSRWRQVASAGVPTTAHVVVR